MDNCSLRLLCSPNMKGLLYLVSEIWPQQDLQVQDHCVKAKGQMSQNTWPWVTMATDDHIQHVWKTYSFWDTGPTRFASSTPRSKVNLVTNHNYAQLITYTIIFSKYGKFTIYTFRDMDTSSRSLGQGQRSNKAKSMGLNNYFLRWSCSPSLRSLPSIVSQNWPRQDYGTNRPTD